MSVTFASPAGQEMAEGTNYKKFFHATEVKLIEEKFQPREQPNFGIPTESCKTNLFFGFFFDGTNNNYADAEPLKCMSNVARLYDCFPGLSVPGVLPKSTDWQYKSSNYTHFFKVYAPGVGTRFPQVGDSGVGMDKTTGAAFGALGERRIIWALAQAINNVHRYFYKSPLIQPSEMEALLRSVTLNKYSLAVMSGEDVRAGRDAVRGSIRAATVQFEKLLTRLHAAVKQHWPDEKTGRPAKVDPGIVKTIYVSIFGYSRGATQARAFANWLQALCRLDSRMRGKPNGLSLGGFNVEFDFLGVFDTVASVGAANSAYLFNGHGAWADSEVSLRVPAGVKCLHLVAAHELRRSFPLDSISAAGALPPGCSEIVVPGVHSDVGGGYCPGEQGRGTDKNGDDMLSRIPLLMMYKAARLSGVPLKLEFAAPAAQERFAVKPETIKAFNAYIATCKQTSGPLHTIMREQARKQMEWRLQRRIDSRTPIQNSVSFLRASTYDQNDLHSAAVEFEDEVRAFEAWLGDKGRAFRPASQKAGFDDSRNAEWEEIATWWPHRTQPEPEVMRFFDEYVHDSHAWFKVLGPDDDAAMHALLRGWVQSLKSARDQKQPALIGKADYRVAPGTEILTVEKRRAAEDYERTGKIPRMFMGGREPGGGYLRYRKVYGGHDSVLLSSAEPGTAVGTGVA